MDNRPLFPGAFARRMLTDCHEQRGMASIFHFILSYLPYLILLSYVLLFCLAMGSSSLSLYSLDTCHTAVVWAVVLLFCIALCCVILPCYFFYCFFTSFYCCCCFYCFYCFCCLLSLEVYIRVGSIAVFPHPDLFVNTLVYWLILWLPSLMLSSLSSLFIVLILSDISHSLRHNLKPNKNTTNPQVASSQAE